MVQWVANSTLNQKVDGSNLASSNYMMSKACHDRPNSGAIIEIRMKLPNWSH